VFRALPRRTPRRPIYNRLRQIFVRRSTILLTKSLIGRRFSFGERHELSNPITPSASVSKLDKRRLRPTPWLSGRPQPRRGERHHIVLYDQPTL
jgi:hypothetical protein